MPKNSHPLEIDFRLVCDVGMLAIQWGRVEWTLKKIVIAVVGAKAAPGLLLTGDMGFRALANFLSCVVQSKPKGKERLMADLETLLEEGYRLYALRNSFVHNVWTSDEEPSEDERLLVVRFRGKIQLYSEHWSDDQRSQIVDDVVAYLIGLTELARKHRLFKPFHDWEKRAVSEGTVDQLRPARPRGRSPKTEEVLRRLRALPE